MHIPQLVYGLAAVHAAALAQVRPAAPRWGAMRPWDVAHAQLASDMALAVSAVRAAGIAIGPAQAAGARAARLPSAALRRSRRSRPASGSEGPAGKGAYARSVSWLPQIVSAGEDGGTHGLPPMPSLAGCAVDPAPSATPSLPAGPDVLEILIDARSSMGSDGTDRDQASREVHAAYSELAWMCGGHVYAERRQQEWLALSDATRTILRQLELLHGAWSPLSGPAVTDDEREIALTAVVEGGDVSAFGVDEICRFGWMRGVHALVAPFHSRSECQTPLDFLKAVYDLTHAPMSRAIGTDLRLTEDIDGERLEAARQLYGLARYADYGWVETGGVQAARQRFRQALADDLALQRRSIEFIPDIAPSYRETALWHDGFAIRGASGMSASTIAAQAQAQAQAQGKGVARAEAKRLAERRLWDRRESTDYLIGTPQQAMATVLLRLGPQFGIASDGLDDAGCLLARFRLLEDRIQASRNYPLGATLLAARYCARASGLLDSSRFDEETLLVREVRTMMLAGGFDGQTHRAAGNPALTFEWRHLPAMARADRRLTNATFEIAAVQAYRHLQHTREIIVRPDMAQLNLALLEWYRDRLLAYQRIPVFDTGDMDAAARQRFTATLATTTPLRARSREILRMARQPLSDTNIGQVAAGIATDATAGDRAGSSGLDEALARIPAKPPGSSIERGASGSDKPGGSAWESAIDWLPVLGPAYRIEQGMWHKNWRQAGMGVARLGVDVLFIWMGGIAAHESAETAETVAIALKDCGADPFELPAVAMLKDYQSEAHGLDDGIAPRGTGDYADVGDARSYELRYSEEGAGPDDDDIKSFPLMPGQFVDAPPIAGGADLRRTVEDCKSFFQHLRETERAGAGCGLSSCLPAVAAGVGDLFVSRLPALQTRIREVERAFGASPSFRRLGGHARSFDKTPFSVSDGGRWSPRTMLKHRQIHMQDDAALATTFFIGFLGPEPFVPLEVLQHEMVHGMTFLQDNAGKFPWLHRGPILPICDQINYESNRFFPQRIAYQRYFSAEESLAKYEQAREAHAGVRAAALKENVELDTMFASLNQRQAGYLILGTPAGSRVTVAQVPRLASAVLGVFSRRPRTFMPVRYFAEYFKARGGQDYRAVAAQRQMVSLLRSLCNRSEVFLGTAERWILDSADQPWKFVFGEPYWPGDPLQAWRVDPETRTVHFNSRPMHYLSRGGPEMLMPARAIVGYFVEAVYGASSALAGVDAGLNRGPNIFLENLIFEELGKIGQRVSAELSDTPELLWDKVVFASKAASDEDLRLKAQVSRLETH